MNPTPVNLDEPLIPKSRNQTISSDYKYLEDPDGEFSRPGETLNKQPTVTIHEGYEQLPEKKNKPRKREARWSVKLPFLQIHKHKHPDFVPLDVQKKPLTLIYDFVNYQKEHEELRAGSESASTASEPPSPTERLRRSQSNMMVSGLQKLKTSISHTYHEKLLHGKTCREFLKGRGIAIWHKMKKPIRPDHPLRIAWDVMLITLVLIDMVILPLNVAFEYPKGSLSFNIFNDVVFLLDIALSFNTSYYAYGNLVVDRRRIAKNYVRSWLFLDVLAAFPFSAFEYVADWESKKGHISYLRLVKVVKIIRAIKFFKLNRIFFKLKILFSSSPKWTSFFQFLQLMIVVMIMAHWLGCGWYLMAILEVQFTGVDNNWIVMKGIQDLDLGGLYAYSVYWAFTTMLTVGYGDVVPATTQEVIYSIVAMLIGCSIFAYALGGVSSIIQAFGQDKDNMSANSYAMDRFLNHFKLEPELTSRIRGYMQHLIEGEHKKTKYKEQFLDLMTDNLRKDILVAIHGDALAQNRVFKDNFGQRFLKEVSHELEEMTFCDGDPVYTEDTLDTAFYMITKGRMGIYIHGEDHPVRMLQSGDYFGELSFFSGDRRTMTIRSSNYSQVFAIHQEAFLSIMERYEDDKETYHEICDKIRLYHDYSALHMRCVACAHHTHSVRYCPMLNYRPSVQEIVESIEEDKRAFLESFTRRAGGKFHARSNLQELRKAVEQLRDDFEERHNYRNRHSANSKVVKSNSLRAMDTMFRAQQTGFRFSAEPKVGGVQKPSIFNLPANVKKASVDSLPSEQMDRKAPSLKSLKEMAEDKEEDRDGESTPKAIINEVNHIEEYCRKHNIDLPEGSMGQLLNSIMASKQKEQEVVVFDQVKSFRNYFKHNNVEEVVRRLNSLNKVGFFNHLKEEKEEPLALEIVLFEPSSNPRKMSSTYPDHKAMTKLNEKEFTDQGPLVIRRVKSCETH